MDGQLLYMLLLQFKFSNGEPRARALKDFSWEKSSFSRKFKSARSAEDFVAIWKKEVVPYHDDITGAYQGETDKSTEQLQDMDETSPTPKRLKEDHTDENEGKIDKIIEDAYIGKTIALSSLLYFTSTQINAQ